MSRHVMIPIAMTLAGTSGRAGEEDLVTTAAAGEVLLALLANNNNLNATTAAMLMASSSSASSSSSGGGEGGRHDDVVGLILALSSSIFIGSSFVVKKKGLKLSAASGIRAGAGGYSYLLQPLWWMGTLTMLLGEIFNFAAYAFAPAVLVTPLGAISIIVSALLAHVVLHEQLHALGWMGCLLCVMGSMNIVLNAPAEGEVTSVIQVWALAMQPEFLMYVSFVCVAVAVLMSLAKEHGSSNILVYVGICSLTGSLSVMSVKALGIALKLTFEGNNQLMYMETGYSAIVVAVCVVTQLNYLNKALDIFNTAVVTPIYYVFFTSFTILASTIMFKDWKTQTATQIVMELIGFMTILCGTALLHATKDFEGGAQGRNSSSSSSYTMLLQPSSSLSTNVPNPSNTTRRDAKKEDLVL